MFPLIFLLLGCVCYTILGVLCLALIPSLRLTFSNLLAFIVGAFPVGLVFLFIYGRVFAKDQLSDVAFFGIFPVLGIGGVVGGSVSVWAKTRMFWPHIRKNLRDGQAR